MITMKHNLAYILKIKLFVTELKLMTRSHFIEILMILTKYVFNVSVRLIEYSVTAESVTLRFYCRCYFYFWENGAKYVLVTLDAVEICEVFSSHA